MGLRKRGRIWWYEFVFAGRRIQESAKTTRKTIAVEAERGRHLELEKTLAGIPVEKRENRIRSVSDVVKRYLEHYGINHREKSVLFARGRLANVKRLLGGALLPDLTEHAIRSYVAARLKEGASGRTINMELGELSRAMGGKWSLLWPNVRKLEERRDVGRALSPEEEKKLLQAVATMRSPLVGAFVRIALLTGMRAGEITSLIWERVDLANRVVTVGRAKTSSGTGRQIPMNPELFKVLSAHAKWFTARFGIAGPEQYLFPFGKPMPRDPTKPITDISSAWDALRDASGVRCRLHDLRHTAATKMAEAGVPESTMLALMGHMSRAMLERYSHVRMAAKRTAVKSLSLKPARAGGRQNKYGVPTKVPTVADSGLIQ